MERIICPKCNRDSGHPEDIKHKFCGDCGFHSWEDEVRYQEKENFYSYLVKVNGKTCAIEKFIFTWGVVIGISRCFREGRYCFDTKANALLFLKDYVDSEGEARPKVGEDGCTAIKI